MVEIDPAEPWLEGLPGHLGRLRQPGRVDPGAPSGFELAHGLGFHEYLARNPAAARAYDDAMATTVDAFDGAAASYDFSKMRTVVDVGGGGGGFLVALLMRYPETIGIKFDRPEVISNIDTSRIPAVVRNRFKLVGGDFFEDELPEGDAFVLCMGWPTCTQWPYTAAAIAARPSSVSSSLPLDCG